MGKKTFAMLIVAVVALFAGYNMYQSQSNVVALSELALANMEALAGDEGGGSSNSWTCWSQEERGKGYWRCGNPCVFVDGSEGKGDTSKCYK